MGLGNGQAHAGECHHDIDEALQELSLDLRDNLERIGDDWAHDTQHTAESLIHLVDEFSDDLRAILDPKCQAGILACVSMLMAYSHIHPTADAGGAAMLIGDSLVVAIDKATE